MEAAGPSMGQATPSQSTSQLSPKKSPKKHPNKSVNFRQNSNNSSPKRSLNYPSSSNPQNVPLSTPMSPLQNQIISTPILTSQNYPSTSTNRSLKDPFPKRLAKTDPFSAAIENFQNKSSPKISQESSDSQVREVQSLMITVHNDPGTFVRTVQSDATQPGGLVEGDGVPGRPFQFRFPQARAFEYDPPHSRQPYRVSAFQERQQAKKRQISENKNSVHIQRSVKNEVQPQRIVHNHVQPRLDVQKEVQPQRIVQNDVQSPRIVQNDVEPQRVVRTTGIQAEGTVQDGVNLGRSYQPRFPKRPQYAPYRGEWRTQKKDAVNPTTNSAPEATGEATTQPELNHRQKKLYQQDPNYYKKVIISGYPAYTKPEELLKKLAVLGDATLETFKNRVAVLTFKTEQEANAALQANETIPVYGTILNITKYTGNKHVMAMIKANRRVQKTGGPPIIAPTQLDLSGDFNQQLQNIEDAIRLTQEEVANINLLFEDIEKYMRMIFPTCEAVPFGSITTGQGIKSSDADCFLSLAGGAAGRPGAGAGELCSQFVSRAARLLRLYPDVFAQLVPIPRANTPIIKFLHVPTNVHCDLNSKTPLGVQNSRLVGHLLRREARFGSAALLLKYWARVHQLSGTGRLTNYALLLLLVFYLQQQTLVPPVYKLQGPEHSFLVENWEAGFDRSPLPFLREVPPLRDLLGGFFLYYANFDFDVHVVCPFLGRPLRKAEFESNALPPQFWLYLANISSGLALPVRTSSCVCVQDPFELSHNVAAGVSCRLAADIKAHLKLAAAAYTEPETSPGDFLRSVLLSRPAALGAEAVRGGAARLSLGARLLAELPEEWRAPLRDALLDKLYKEILLVELTRTPHVSRESEVDQEVYCGVLRRPVWRRPAPPRAAAALARQRDLSLRLQQNKQLADVHMPIEVTLGFRNKPPRGCSICVSAMEGANEEEFKAFRTFVNTFIHRWQRALLAAHLRVDPTRVPAEPANRSPRKGPKKKANESGSKEVLAKAAEPTARTLDSPIKTVAFVNSNHKDLSESLAAVSLNCSNQDSTHSGDAS